MTLPPFTGAPGSVFEWRPTRYDLVPLRASALGSGWMIAGWTKLPCELKGPDGLIFNSITSFPVKYQFPDVANDPYFAGVDFLSIDLMVSAYLGGPGHIIKIDPCTTVPIHYPARMSMRVAVDEPGGLDIDDPANIALDANGEPLEWIFNGVEWVGYGHGENVLSDAFIRNTFQFHHPTVGGQPRWWFIIDSGFFTNYYPSLGIIGKAADLGEDDDFVPPPLPPPPMQGPPMPACDTGIPSTVRPGDLSSGVVPLQP
jgi:hypothetical protein